MFDKLKASLFGKWDDAEEQAKAMAMVLFAQMGLGPEWQEAAQNPFSMDSRAQVGGANRATNLVVGLVVAGLMAAFLLPIAIEEIANVSTSNWDDGAASLWGVLPIMIVLAIFLFFVGLALKSS